MVDINSEKNSHQLGRVFLQPTCVPARFTCQEALEAEEPENNEAKQKEVFGFDIDKSLLVGGATIVFVFLPKTGRCRAFSCC